MPKAPPLLSTEILRRMLRLARRDGVVVLAVAGPLAIISAVYGDYRGALVGVIIAGAGVFELHGTALLKAGKPQGVNWLVGSQLYLLVAVLGYIGWQLRPHNAPLVLNFMQRVLHSPMIWPLMQSYFEATGVTEADTLHRLLLMYNVGLAVVIVLTLFYQGGMALYYHRRRAAVTAALADEGS